MTPYSWFVHLPPAGQTFIILEVVILTVAVTMIWFDGKLK